VAGRSHVIRTAVLKYIKTILTSRIWIHMEDTDPNLEVYKLNKNKTIDILSPKNSFPKFHLRLKPYFRFVYAINYDRCKFGWLI